MNKNLKKNFIWNTIGSFVISITSLIYTIILTWTSKLDVVGLFTFAFSYACMMVTLASFGGRTFQVTDTKNKVNKGTYILTKYLTVLITLFLVIVYVFIKKYTFYKSEIIVLLCIFKFLEEISDVYYGILQKKDKLYIVGKCQFIKSIINVTLFFIGLYFIKNLYVSVILMLLCNFTFALFIERKIAYKTDPWTLNTSKTEIVYLLKNNFLICMYLFLGAYIVNSPKYAIDDILKESDQAIFNIIIMPATFMLLVGGFIMNPLLVSIADNYNNGKNKEVISTLKKITLSIIVIGIIVLILGYLIGIPFLNIIYHLKLNKYKISLMVILIGSIFYTITTCYGNILIAMRKIKPQLVITIFLSILSFILSRVLVKSFGLVGGFYCYTLIMIIRFVLYIIYINLSFRSERL